MQLVKPYKNLRGMALNEIFEAVLYRTIQVDQWILPQALFLLMKKSSTGWTRSQSCQRQERWSKNIKKTSFTQVM